MSLDQIIGKQTQFQPQEHYSNGISNGLHNSNGNGAMLNGRATRGNGRGASLLDVTSAPPGQRILKIGGNSRVKNIAGAISHVCRSGPPPTLLALGSSPVNISVKATAIANGYLVNDNISVVMVPQFREGELNNVVPDNGPKPLAFMLYANVLSQQDLNGREPYTLTIASSSRPGIVAGAIAGKVRENYQPILKGIGAESVHTAVRSVAIAQKYLEEDSTQICVVPEFAEETPKKDGSGTNETRTVMVMKCYAVQRVNGRS